MQRFRTETTNKQPNKQSINQTNTQKSQLYIFLTYTSVCDVFPYASFKEAAAPITTVHAVVFAIALVTTHLTRHGDGQRAT